LQDWGKHVTMFVRAQGYWSLQQEWQALDSFFTFLRRLHDIGYQRLMYLNLIKFTRKIMTKGHFKKKAGQLAERIRSEPYVAEREWLLEKLVGR
jgi:hypothetical protein